MEVLSNGKYKVKENQSYSNITKRRLLHSLRDKLSPQNNRIVNPRHSKKSNKDRYMKEHSGHKRSGSLPTISNDSTGKVFKTDSHPRLRKLSKFSNQHFGSNHDLSSNKSYGEQPYGKANRRNGGGYGDHSTINPRQVLARVRKQKQNRSFNVL